MILCLDSLMYLHMSGKRRRKDQLCKEAASLSFDFTHERLLIKHVRIYECWYVVQGKKYSNFPLFLSLLPPWTSSSSSMYSYFSS